MGGQTEWERKLEDALVRVQGAIARAQQRHEEALKAQGLDPEKYRLDWRAARRQVRAHVREERHRARHERKVERASKPQGFVFAAAAAVLLAFAVLNPSALWWLVFIAFGFGQAAAGILSKAYERDRRLTAARQDDEAAPPEADGEGAKAKPKPVEADPGAAAITERLGRIDALCEKLVAEVKSGREALKLVVQNPEQTVQALRKTCHELARREGELRKLVTSADEARLLKERDQLSFRIGAEKDEVVRARLGSALAALDEQLRRRGELMTDAARLEAESVRLLYTLENLYTQVLRVRSADAGSVELAGAGVRQSLERLGHEMDAVAEALESVGREGGMTPVSPVGASASEAGQAGSAATRERG